MKKLLTIIALAFALAAPALAQNTTQKINKKNLVIKDGASASSTARTASA